MIKNLVTGRVYVGSSRSIKERIYFHKNALKKNKHFNKILQNSYNKHGKEAFKFSIIEECEREKLVEREQFWVDWYRINGKVYNVRVECVNNMLGFKHSEETKRKIGKSFIGRKKEPLSEEAKERLRKAFLGKKHTEEARKKMSLANKGRIPWIAGKHHTEEAKKKIRKASKERSEETKEKIRKARLGRKVSEETKLKIKKALKNHIVTEESRRKMREANLGKKLSEEHRRKISEGNKGKIVTEETKQKISKANKGHKHNLGKKRSKETCEKISKALTGRKLSGETKLKIKKITKELWKRKDFREKQVKARKMKVN